MNAPLFPKKPSVSTALSVGVTASESRARQLSPGFPLHRHCGVLHWGVEKKNAPEMRASSSLDCVVSNMQTRPSVELENNRFCATGWKRICVRDKPACRVRFGSVTKQKERGDGVHV